MTFKTKIKSLDSDDKITKELKEEINTTDIDLGGDDVMKLLREMIKERADGEGESKELVSMMEDYYARNRGK